MQWAFITSILMKKHEISDPTVSELDAKDIINDSISSNTNYTELKVTPNLDTFRGVAATLMINSPKWFQRRYTMMISNILLNIPPDWAVQIFYTGTGLSQIGLDINPGLVRLASTNDRIVLTKIPEEVYNKHGMKKRILYWTDEWIWKEMLADRILVFSGNGVLCSNSKLSIADGTATILNDVDYIGTPWREFWGAGGDGTISYRNRTAMLHAIRFRKHDGNEREDRYFVRTLLEINEKEGTELYRVASKEQTLIFGGTENIVEVEGPPMVVSGTMPNIDHELRETVLDLCPELRMIFPVLHNPNCFGANPDGEECAKYICALKNPDERMSGC